MSSDASKNALVISERKTLLIKKMEEKPRDDLIKK